MDQSAFERHLQQLDNSTRQLKRRLKNIMTIQQLAGSSRDPGEFDYNVLDVEFTGPLLEKLEKMKLEEVWEAFDTFRYQLDQIKMLNR